MIGPDLLAGGDAPDVALGELEDVDRQVVLHAERERGRVHHAQPALDRLEVRERRQERRVRVVLRVAVVDAPHAVLRHQDRLGADLERAQRGGRVGREERVAGAGREDHDAALLEVAHRPAADVRLGDLGDLERRQHARVGAAPLERVLQRERVEHGREHARRSRPWRGPCPRPPRPCRGRCCRRRRRSRARALRLDADDLARDRVDRLRVDAVLAVAHQRLARELQQDAAEGGSGARRRPLRQLLVVRRHAPILRRRSA